MDGWQFYIILNNSILEQVTTCQVNITAKSRPWLALLYILNLLINLRQVIEELFPIYL